MSAMHFVIAFFAMSLSMLTVPLSIAQESPNGPRGREAGDRDRQPAERSQFRTNRPKPRTPGPNSRKAPTKVAPHTGVYITEDNKMYELIQKVIIQSEIELLPEQREAVKKIPRFTHSDRNDFSLGVLHPEKEVLLLAKHAIETNARLREILRPEQFERLEQIVVQARGVTGLINPGTSKNLSLTQDQIQKLTVEMKTFEKLSYDLTRDMFKGASSNTVQKEVLKLKVERDEKLLALLTDQQKIEFEKLKGEHFAPAETPLDAWSPFSGERKADEQ